MQCLRTFSFPEQQKIREHSQLGQAGNVRKLPQWLPGQRRAGWAPGMGTTTPRRQREPGTPSSFPPTQRSRRRTHRGQIPLRSLPALPPAPWRCPGILRGAASAEHLPCPALLRRAWLFGFVCLHPSSGSSRCSLGQTSFRSARLRPPRNFQPGLRCRRGCSGGGRCRRAPEGPPR